MINPTPQTPANKEGFDAISYFTRLCRENRLCAANGFKPAVASTPMSLEGVLQQMKSTANFIAIDDTNDGNVSVSDGGFFKRTTYTVWILARHKALDMNDRQEALNLCRTIYRQFLARVLKDKYQWELDFTYLLTDQVDTRELGAYFLNGATGVEFHLDVQQPIDITYNPDEWQQL